MAFQITSKRNYSSVSYSDEGAVITQANGWTVVKSSSTENIEISVKLADGTCQTHKVDSGEEFKYDPVTGRIEVKEKTT